MQGVRKFHGQENVALILVNNGGHDQRTIDKAKEYIERYGVEEALRVRLDEEEFAKQVVATFGHFSYGQIVIDSKGILLGTNLAEHELEYFVARGRGARDPFTDLEGFSLETDVKNLRGGRGLFNALADKLPKDMTGTIVVSLSIPDGWYVRKDNVSPAKAKVDYAGTLETGLPVLENAEQDKLTGTVKFEIPVTAQKGTPIGRYFVFGDLQFVACNEKMCLPPVKVPWKVVVDAL